MSNEIFRSLSAIPGVGYEGHPDVDRRRLPRHDDRPRVHSSSIGGGRDVFVTWDLPGGVSTSQSPASAWASVEQRDAAPAEVLRRLYEALELPGSASDYHFALLRTCEELWGRRVREPEILPEIEQLLLHDIRLVETRPETVRNSAGGREFTASVPAFSHLIRLYERDGYIEDALDIARRAAALGLGGADLQRLEARLQELRDEDVP